MTMFEKLKNLMVMAAADGNLTERELNFLSDRCRKWGFNDGEFSAALRYAMQPDAKISIPEAEADRRAMLQDLIKMMAADGDLADIEKQIFATVAAQMQISDQELNRLIDEVMQSPSRKT